MANVDGPPKNDLTDAWIAPSEYLPTRMDVAMLTKCGHVVKCSHLWAIKLKAKASFDRASSAQQNLTLRRNLPTIGIAMATPLSTPVEDSTRTVWKSPLYEMTQTTATCLWNDSAALDELKYSLSHGAVGATCNPVIALEVLKQEMHLWKDRIVELIEEMPGSTEDEIAWALIEELSAKRAALLKDIFDRQRGHNGRLSIQTDPRLYRSVDALVAQACRFSELAPNMIVKLPATRAGIAAMEEVTARGISVNATVSFTLPQCIAVAEAIERGLQRREQAGRDISTIGSVCTIMVGRLDDWLKVVAEKRNVITNPGYLEWAGVAVFKKAYRLFRERGYRVRLLSAAFRNHLHWSELIGGDVVISPPYKWQLRFNASDVKVESRIDTPVDPTMLAELLKKFPDFERAYNEEGLAINDFDSFGPTRRTMRQFVEACHEMCGQIRDIMIPNPDKLLG